MAWTTPRTWVAGETVTASVLNTHVRDNLTALRSSLSTVVYRATTQSIPDTTITAIDFDAETTDTPGWHSTSSNTSRITPDVAGLYLVVGGLSLAANATGLREAVLRRSGTDIARQGQGLVVSASASLTINVTAVAPANGTTDYFELYARQTSGGALNANSGAALTWLAVTFLGA